MKNILLLFCLAISINNVFGQTDSTSIQTDTTLVLDQTLNIIIKNDSIKKADSLEKVFLQRQLEDLSKVEYKKRAELEKKLNELNAQDSLKRIKSKKEIDSLKLVAKSFPIIPYEDTLFLVFTKVGKITAHERSEIINQRLKEVYNDFILQLDSIEIVDYGQSVDVVFKDKTIMSITEYDAIWFEKSKLEIASEYKAKIDSDILFYKENKSLFTLLKQIGLALLVIIIQIALVKGVNLLFKNKIDQFILNQKGKKLKGIHIKDYQFLDAERLTNVVLFISKTFRWTLNLVQLYITIPLLFSIFPPTQRLAETLFGYILSPLKKIGSSFFNYLPNLFTIIVIVVLTRYIIRFIRFLSSEVESENLKLPGFYADWARPTFNIVRFLILAFMFVMIFPYLPGSDSAVFQGVSVFLGIVFSLGSSSVIGNMIAGLVMTYMRPFQIGDRIKIDDIIGDVVERTAFVTRIKTPKKEYITVPNSNILSSNIVNFSTSRTNEGIILYPSVTIGYDVPWREVHQLLIAAAKKTNKIKSEPEPFVLQTSLDDFYISYQLNAYTNAPRYQAQIYSELYQNIQDAFNEAGVEILSPHYRAQRDGNYITIPSDYLSKDYKPTSFRVENTNKSE